MLAILQLKRPSSLLATKLGSFILVGFTDRNYRTARNSKPIEVLGTYDPIPKPPREGEGKPWKDIKLDTVRAKYWLGVGAQPSDPAWRLLSLVSSGFSLGGLCTNCGKGRERWSK